MRAWQFVFGGIFLSMFMLAAIHSAFDRQIYLAILTLILVAALAGVFAEAAQERTLFAARAVTFFGGIFIAIELLGIIRHWHSNPLARQIGIVTAASLGLETTLCVWLILRRSSRKP
jgi:hypothetical protein